MSQKVQGKKKDASMPFPIGAYGWCMINVGEMSQKVYDVKIDVMCHFYQCMEDDFPRKKNVLKS